MLNFAAKALLSGLLFVCAGLFGLRALFGQMTEEVMLSALRTRLC